MKQAVDVHKVFAEYFKGVEALAYAVSKTLAEGSICLDIKKYEEQLSASENPTDLNPFLGNGVTLKPLLDEGPFVTYSADTLKPFIIYNDKVYLHRYFTYETQIINNIKRLGDKFIIITGGPGTGKTYSVAKELKKLFKKDPEQKVAMAAPTGKAAARMEESIRKFTADPANSLTPAIKEKLNALKAETIHRLLGHIRNSVFFRHNENKRLPYDVVVIDEASMIDGAMMAKLLNAIGENTRFYLIGDKDQLASVEAGSVFGDICEAVIDDVEQVEQVEKVEKKMWTGGVVEKLLKNYRAEGPEIIKFSKKLIELIEGETDFILNYKNNDEVTIEKPVNGKFSDELFKIEVLLYKEYIEEKDIKNALKLLNRVRVLCVTREHDHSVAEANAEIEKLLKKAINDPKKFNPKAGLYHNQPIIITKNDYDLGLNNGDVGLIREDGNVLKAYFEDGNSAEGYKPFSAGYLNHYETVFAMTIHKSQGSEFDHVVVRLPEKQARKLLTRELLYTAVTRAKERVLVQTTDETLKHCLEHKVSRASGLTERMKDAK